jgi:filamentous hemagglutinin family protein
MNKVFKIIWNRTRGLFVVASEIAVAASKGGRSFGTSGSYTFHFLTIHLLKLKSLSIACLATLSANAFAVDLPTAGNITSGTGTISVEGTVMTVSQDSAKLVTDWQSFSIGDGYAVNFKQPDSSSVALNRVLGTDPSRIFGALTSNGKVFLVNPNGIFFSRNAQVNVGGIVASTLNLKNIEDFISEDFNDRFEFSGASEAHIINEGKITANGSYVSLIAASVINTG